MTTPLPESSGFSEDAACRRRAADAVWSNGMEHAVPVGRVKNLFLTPPPPPRPPEAMVAEVPLAAAAPMAFVSPSGPLLSEVLLGDPLLAGPGVMAATSAEQAPVPPSSQPRAGADSDTWSRPKMRRAVAVKRAVLLSQNGYHVQYRKK